jgi:TldD protein
MTDPFSAALRALEKAGATFGDLRTEDRRAFAVRMANGQVESVNEMHRSGWGVRSFVNGAWGYASGTSGRASDLVVAAKKATAIAQANAAAGVPKTTLRGIPTGKRTHKAACRIDPADIGGEEKVSLARELCQAIAGDRVASTLGFYNEADQRCELGNTAGARVAWREVRVRLGGQAIAQEGDRQEMAIEIKDASAGWEFIKTLDPVAFGQEMGREARERLQAIKPPAGLRTVILDPDASGLLAHEVMGHASEGDEIVKQRSFLSKVVGKRVGSGLVSMYDDGTLPGGHGTIPVDSEGTPAHKTTIIDHGIYRGYMQSLETAGSLKVRPTGNGRAQDFGRRVWVRMTNTYFAPGRDAKDAIIEDTKDGILTKGWISGMEDIVGGGFQAVTQSGFLVKDGELGPRVRGMTLTGKALAILKSVDRVSKEFAVQGGTCGKGEADDYVPVGTGGPYMRAKVVVGGG